MKTHLYPQIQQRNWNARNANISVYISSYSLHRVAYVHHETWSSSAEIFGVIPFAFNLLCNFFTSRCFHFGLRHIYMIMKYTAHMLFFVSPYMKVNNNIYMITINLSHNYLLIRPQWHVKVSFPTICDAHFTFNGPPKDLFVNVLRSSQLSRFKLFQSKLPLGNNCHKHYVSVGLNWLRDQYLIRHLYYGNGHQWWWWCNQIFQARCVYDSDANTSYNS